MRTTSPWRLSLVALLLLAANAGCMVGRGGARDFGDVRVQRCKSACVDAEAQCRAGCAAVGNSEREKCSLDCGALAATCNDDCGKPPPAEPTIPGELP